MKDGQAARRDEKEWEQRVEKTWGARQRLEVRGTGYSMVEAQRWGQMASCREAGQGEKGVQPEPWSPCGKPGIIFSPVW